jgi:feruloyl-CoA synthase
VNDPKVRDFVRQKFANYNKQQSGSSTRVKRIILMVEPPSVDGHEITDKGYVNQRATMERRKTLVDKLFAATPASEVIEIP